MSEVPERGAPETTRMGGRETASSAERAERRAERAARSAASPGGDGGLVEPVGLEAGLGEA